MRLVDDKLIFSATDLASFFECAHKTVLDLRVESEDLERPRQSDIERRMLEKRGGEHERRVLEYFIDQGRNVVDVSAEAGGVGASEAAAAATLSAMDAGADLIYQGVLVAGDWVGRPDFLVRTQVPPGKASRFGRYLYEPIDAKLARDEKARAVIQLCAYADQLAQLQEVLPERIWLALGTTEIEPTALRTADYYYYYRQAKSRLEVFAGEEEQQRTDPEPVEHCDVCEWWQRCEKRRRDDDHLSLVAGITRRQRVRLAAGGVNKLVELAELPEGRRIKDIDEGPLSKIRHQARLQHERRTSGSAVYELLTDADPGSGLELLPVPKPGDLFLDLEGDAFVHDGGLEYLFGLLELGEPELGFGARGKPGEPRYTPIWALNRAEEKAAFERVMDRIKLGREEFKDLHVFHFGHRERTAIQTLSCRHSTREDDVDELLRDGALVDLHTVVRQGLRASVEAYTLKELEVLYGFEREVERRKAAKAMQLFGWWLETGDPGIDPEELRATLAKYNEEDCVSTWRLRDWLEERRSELEAKIERPLTRPERKADEGDKKDERDEEAATVARQLTEGLPEDPAQDSSEQRARRLLADLLGWHWRELKSGYWEYHQAREVPPSEWLESRFILDGLNYEGVVGQVKQSLVHRYTFPEQEHSIREFPAPEVAGTKDKTANIEDLGPDFVLIKRGKRNKDDHPTALRPGRPISGKDQERQLLAVAKSVAQRGLDDRSEFAAARDLLLRSPPRCGQQAGAPLVDDGEDTVEAVKRLCLQLDHSVLAIQGPPGSGKTYRAAEAILALIQAGKKVGVTANSHSVILGVLKKVHAGTGEVPISIQHIGDPDKFGGNPPPFPVQKKYATAAEALRNGSVQLMGGTAFAWAKECMTSSVDVLVVDEAGQMSLANVLAVSTAAKSVVLLGDPAQLEQPQKGVHPPGADASALEHLLGDALTMPRELGVFLPETRRLHPQVCKFTSEVFYDGRLRSIGGLEKQSIRGPEPFNGSGLRYVPAPHEGNTNRSDEEVRVVAEIVDRLFESKTEFVDKNGKARRLRERAPEKDVLVVAPYNAQVAALTHRLDLGRVAVGTVDKFQGKEAPIVIYSMTTSSGEEAPHGLEFLYSLNRVNVATSRAQAMVILVASPELTRARCRTPRQLRLVNALCAYLAGAAGAG